MGVSIDWCVTIEYWRSSSIKIIFIDYQTRELQCNLSQIRYSLVVILELSGVSEVQYKKVMMIDDGKYQ